MQNGCEYAYWVDKERNAYEAQYIVDLLKSSHQLREERDEAIQHEAMAHSCEYKFHQSYMREIERLKKANKQLKKEVNMKNAQLQTVEIATNMMK